MRDGFGIPVHRSLTPATIMLSASDGYFSGVDYLASYSLDGCAPVDVPVRRRIDGWYWGNFLFGGIIGFFFIDPATGPMWKLEPRVHVAMLPLS